MSTLPPRAVLVTRPSELEQLLARHATRGQVEFFLRTRSRSIEELDGAHDRLAASVQTMSAAIPRSWRRSAVTREDLPRFAFEPQDIVIVVGQDGLVANVAKYLDGQPVFGVNPDPASNPGVLVPLAARDAAALLTGRPAFRRLTMARATTDVDQTSSPSTRSSSDIPATRARATRSPSTDDGSSSRRRASSRRREPERPAGPPASTGSGTARSTCPGRRTARWRGSRGSHGQDPAWTPTLPRAW